MKKVLWMAACAALVTAVTVNAATLTLAIKSGTVSEVTVAVNAIVPISITGLLSGPATDGLALWGVDATNSAGVDAYDAPAGDMQFFKKNAGLTNPAGYGGTVSGAALLQIGGGQNTINYHGTTPSYPTGGPPIAEGVADTTEEALATGTLDTAGLLVNTDHTVTIANGFANTLNFDQAGPVYAVSPATVVLGAATLTVHIRTTCTDPVIQSVASVATHGGSNTAYPLAIGASTIEPRKVVASSRLPINAYIEVTFDQTMAAGAQPVTANPLITGIAASSTGTNVVTITFPVATPADQTGYRISLAGATGAVGGCQAASTANFCIRYLEGDVDRNALVQVSDKNTVISLTNWNTAVSAAKAAVDLDRDGTIQVSDKNTVLSLSNWNTTPSACP